MKYIYYITGINPEPWAIGPLGVGRKGGKIYPYVGPNPQLKNYQLAIREAMEDRNAVMLDVESLRLSFYFWRCTEAYRSAADQAARKHDADATNLQKGIEDALQGILYPNDRVVRDVRSQIVRQDASVAPLVIIVAETGYEPDLSEIPSEIWNEIDNQPSLISANKNHTFEELNPEDIF